MTIGQHVNSTDNSFENFISGDIVIKLTSIKWGLEWILLNKSHSSDRLSTQNISIPRGNNSAAAPANFES